MEFIEVLVTVVPRFLWDSVHVVVTAIPAGFGLPLIMVATGTASLFAMDYWA